MDDFVCDRGRGRRLPVQHGPVDRRDAGAGRARASGPRRGWPRSSRPRTAARPARPRPPQGLFLVRVRYGRASPRTAGSAIDADRPRHHPADPRRGPGEHPADRRGAAPPLRRRRDPDHRPGRGARGRPLRPGRRAGPEGRADARAGPRDPARRPTCRAYRQLRAAIRRLRPEVVHTHSSKAGILGRAAAWHERVPAVVHTIHGLPFGPFETPLEEPALHRPRALGGPAVPRDRQRLRRDDRAGPGRRGRPARAVPRPSTAAWTSTPS